MLKLMCFCFCMLFQFLQIHAFSDMETENADGSYSNGRSIVTTGDTGESVAAYLTGSSGWNPISGQPRNQVGIEFGAQIPQLISSSVSVVKQAPFLEILKLIENFLKFKGRVGNLLWNLWNDNAHIIAALQTTLISKISSIHNLTLSAVIVLRKVLEFAASLLQNANFSVNTFF